MNRRETIQALKTAKARLNRAKADLKRNDVGDRKKVQLRRVVNMSIGKISIIEKFGTDWEDKYQVWLDKNGYDR